jgi:hypothetical protein
LWSLWDILIITITTTTNIVITVTAIGIVTTARLVPKRKTLIQANDPTEETRVGSFVVTTLAGISVVR